MSIFLASKSPRRREILENLGISYGIIDVEVDEIMDSKESPCNIAMGISFQKSNVASKKLNVGDIVISADTIVVIEGKILGKPEDFDDAFNMLNLLKGKFHQVITGYTIIQVGNNKKYMDFVETTVWFKNYDDDLIKWYIGTGEPFDKAGAYGIQGKGSLLVEKISGDYFNIIGFPISKIFEDIKMYFNLSII